MNVAKKLNGIVGVMNTPFTYNNQIDVESIKRYVNYVVDCGGVGLLATAMAAEINKLSIAERELIIRTTVKEMDNRLPVIGGASASGNESVLDMVELYNSLGCDAVLVSIPFTNEKEYLETIEKISDKIDTALVVQDWDFNGFGIPVATVKKMFERINKFKSLKIEVKPAGVKYTAVINETDGKLNVSGGWASSQMIEALDRGVNAFMSTIFTDIYSKIYKLHRIGKRREAIELFNEFLPVISFSHQHIDISVHFNKHVNYKLGLFSTSNVREPILEFDEYHSRVTEELINKAIKLSKRITLN